VGLLREGFYDGDDAVQSEVTDTVRNAAMSLRHLGVSVEDFSFPMHRRGARLLQLSNFI
jgi:Asp-tRNA(Asn)/Glu-tRNA(Gln) amidotransferase A subunit family amidase